jgi:hypothetical protein
VTYVKYEPGRSGSQGEIRPFDLAVAPKVPTLGDCGGAERLGTVSAVDTDALASWIDERHLDEAALEAYRASFAQDPARMLLLHDFLRADVAERMAAFMATEADFSSEYGLYSVEGPVEADAWHAAPEEDRFFRYGKLQGIKPEAALSDNALAYMQLRSFVTQEPFHDLFEAMTGLELGPSDDFGLHAFRAGDFLLDHDDANRDRRVALVIYLTPEWRSDLGGALLMEDPTGQVRRFDAAFNSLAVFDTLAGTTHRVERVDEAAGDLARCTFGGWFPNPAV